MTTLEMPALVGAATNPVPLKMYSPAVPDDGSHAITIELEIEMPNLHNHTKSRITGAATWLRNSTRTHHTFLPRVALNDAIPAAADTVQLRKVSLPRNMVLSNPEVTAAD